MTPMSPSALAEARRRARIGQSSRYIAYAMGVSHDDVRRCVRPLAVRGQASRSPQSRASRPMTSILICPGRAAVLPMDAMLAAIPQFPRPALNRLVGRMIDRLDEMDGDPDLEPDAGDEDTHDQEKTDD